MQAAKEDLILKQKEGGELETIKEKIDSKAIDVDVEIDNKKDNSELKKIDPLVEEEYCGYCSDNKEKPFDFLVFADKASQKIETPTQDMPDSSDSIVSSVIKSPSPFRTPRKLDEVINEIEEKLTESGNKIDAQSIEERRRQATLKRRKRQDEQADKMKRRRGETSTPASIGDIVVVKVDSRDVPHPRGIQGIAFKVSVRGAGGCQVVTEVGILSHGQGKEIFYIPRSKYSVQHRNSVLSRKLAKIREQVIDGTFDATEMKRLSIASAYTQLYNNENASRPCKCSKGCKNYCGCIKKEIACTAKCGCKGRCYNAEQRIG
jgi:hypothetical protein